MIDFKKLSDQIEVNRKHQRKVNEIMERQILNPNRTIPECLAMAKGTPIEHVQGTARWIGQRRTGNGKFGPWSLQDVSITDGQNEAIVVLKNREELDQQYLNNDLWFSSWVNDEGNVKGVAAGTQKNKDGQFTPCISATKTATIMDADGNDPCPGAVFDNAAPAPQAPARPSPVLPSGCAPAQPQQATLPVSRPAAPAPQPPARPAAQTRVTAGGIVRGSYKSLDHFMKLQADVLGRAVDAVAFIEANKWMPQFGEPLSTEDRRAMAISLLIEANKSGAVWGDCKNRLSDQKDPNVAQAEPTPPPVNGTPAEAPEDWTPEE
jgi:hypothetical protein